MKSKYRYLFGPVPSRRLGRSLGVDLTPYKTCCYDCIFCQLGRTTHLTVDRKEYVKIASVIDELSDWYKNDGFADVITLSGSGEPTLHTRFGEVLEFIRDRKRIPGALLTNGALLSIPEVRDAAACADIVKVSLSAWDQISLDQVNRSHPLLTFDELIEGQKAFRAQFKGQLWMEIFLVNDVNSTPDAIGKISDLAMKIAPDKIQLNTAVRPPSEVFVEPVLKQKLSMLTHFFQPRAEVIAEYRSDGLDHHRFQMKQQNLLAMIKRRPCTTDQIVNELRMHPNDMVKYLSHLIQTKQVRCRALNGAVFFEIVRATN